MALSETLTPRPLFARVAATATALVLAGTALTATAASAQATTAFAPTAAAPTALAPYGPPSCPTAPCSPRFRASLAALRTTTTASPVRKRWIGMWRPVASEGSGPAVRTRAVAQPIALTTPSLVTAPVDAPTTPAPSPVPTATETPAAVPTDAGFPFRGLKVFQDGWNPARDQANAWRSTRPADAALMDRLAAESVARWIGGNDTLEADVSSRMAAAANQGTIPVLVTYNIPMRDCNSYSAGGASSAAAYRAWTRSLASAIGSRKVILVVEPDAVAGMDCLSSTARAERLALLDDAVTVLAALPSTVVYLDAGNSSWQPASVMATRLAAAGVAKARGISLNVSNYQTTSAERSYGAAISAAYGSVLPMVIDTSRNGAGANGEWCNPLGRAVGATPVLGTSTPGVDALLWVKIPGTSDGECNDGPSAGKWWDVRALELTRRAWGG